MASRRKHVPARGTLVKAALTRVWDPKISEDERALAIQEIEAVVPEVKLYMLPDGHGESILWCYVEQGDFEAIPEILRSQAIHIEEVRKDGSGIVYKSEDFKRGPIEKTTKPGYKHKPPRSAWERVLEDD
jgi:hypothetical protein